MLSVSNAIQQLRGKWNIKDKSRPESLMQKLITELSDIDCNIMTSLLLAFMK